MEKNMVPSPVTPENLFDIITIENPQISPDGKTVAFVHMQPEAQTNQYKRSIWLTSTDGNSPPRQFTSGHNDIHPRWSPDNKSLAFVSTRDGLPQIYIMPISGGEPRKFTNLPGGAMDPEWSPDGSKIAYVSTTTKDERKLEDKGTFHNPIFQDIAKLWSDDHRSSLKDPRVINKLPYRTGKDFFDGRYKHIYVASLDNGVPRRLSTGDFHHSPPSWSPDSQYIVTNTNREQSTGDEFFELWSSIIQYDVNTGEEKIIASEVSEEGRSALISPDGNWIAHAYLPKVPSPYAEPYYIAISPFKGNAAPTIISGEDLTVADFLWDHDSKHLLLIIHDQGDAKLMRVSLDGKTRDILCEGSQWTQSFSISKDGKQIAYATTSPLHPSDLFATDISKGITKQLTDFNKKWETEHFISEPTEIRYKSTDNIEIQGWFLKPINFDPKKSYPLAVEIHGGPQIMWGNTFWHEFQVLASRGYFVFYCNPRGSAGYGAEFQRIREKGGYTDMPDIMNGVDATIAREKAIDPNRMVITGGSYGGFLTGWIVGHTKRFKAAVSQRGVYDQLNMFGSGDIPESVEWYHNGIPRPENLSELWEYSPATYAKDVTTPLMILHSELDFRVPVSQAETFFAYLRRYGNKNATMVRYPREGHELSRAGEPLHRVDRIRKIVWWFDLHVQKEKLQPKPMSKNEIQSLLSDLPDWNINNGALEYSIDCGSFTFAVKLINKIEPIANEYDHHPKLILDGSTLTVQLYTHKTNSITDFDLQLAQILSHRLFHQKKQNEKQGSS